MPAFLDPDRVSGRPAAVVLPGAGSTAEFVRRAFGPAVWAAGFRLVGYEPRRGGRPATDQVTDLGEVVRATGARLVGGVSLGAHVAARWAAQEEPDVDGLLLVLPAWIGPAEAVAALSARTAEQVCRDGLPATLARLARLTDGPGGWVAEELLAAWPAYGAAPLVAALREAAATPAPDEGQLAGIGVPAGLVALTGDGFHPETVAREWARLLPAAALEVLALDGPASDRAVLGRAAVRAWRAAVSGSR